MLDVADSDGMLAADGSKIRIRVGIHTGPASFGIVGVKCPKYTLVGDTVNTGKPLREELVVCELFVHIIL